MKFFLTTLFASLASYAAGQAPPIATGSGLATRWQLDEPVVSYSAATNEFTFEYQTASNANTAADSLTTFYDTNCKDDGTGSYTEYVIPSGLTSVQTAHAVGGYPVLTITVDPATLANDGKIYSTIVTGSPLIGTNGITAADIGSGVMNFCVRFDIGYQQAGGAGLKEVNFIETLISIKYDLTVGFTVAAFNVAPKDRLTTTTVKDTYALIGYLCPDPTGNNGTPLVTIDGRLVAAEDQSKLNSVAGAPTAANSFNQGALITVCVRPDPLTVADGIIISSLTDFTWTRGTAPTAITQAAIPDQSGLSVDTCAATGYYCYIESILFAEFYASPGTVTGNGEAQLAFARRMLNEDGSVRKLEEDDATAEFDISAQVAGPAEGPGALKTAGGVSIGSTLLASVVALASAVLLA